MPEMEFRGMKSYEEKLTGLRRFCIEGFIWGDFLLSRSVRPPASKSVRRTERSRLSLRLRPLLATSEAFYS